MLSGENLLPYWPYGFEVEGAGIVGLAEPICVRSTPTGRQRNVRSGVRRARRRFPGGANAIRRPLQPKAIAAAMGVTKWLNTSITAGTLKGGAANVLSSASATAILAVSNGLNEMSRSTTLRALFVGLELNRAFCSTTVKDH
jgi:hypothetical protein